MDENKVRIAVCGDSYCTACTEQLGRVGSRAHFSQILEDQYGYTILHFAHGGFSNTGILFQMCEALKYSPDVIVYNKTWYSRVDIKINGPFERGPFDREQGLKNFIYHNNHMPSTHEPWTGNLDSCILSTTPQGLEHNTLVTPEQRRAVNDYLVYVFDYDLQKTRDEWLFEYWTDKIKNAEILPLCFNDSDIGQIAYEFSEKNQTYDCPFHTDRATQEKVASNIHRKIVDNLRNKV